MEATQRTKLMEPNTAVEEADALMEEPQPTSAVAGSPLLATAAAVRPGCLLLAAAALSAGVLAFAGLPTASKGLAPYSSVGEVVRLSEETGAASEDAAKCAAKFADCRESRCCSDPKMQCFEKNEGWASCQLDCQPGMHGWDAAEFRVSWSCNRLLPDGSTKAPTRKEDDPIQLKPQPWERQILDGNESGRKGSFLVLGDWGFDPISHGGDINTSHCQKMIAQKMA